MLGTLNSFTNTCDAAKNSLQSVEESLTQITGVGHGSDEVGRRRDGVERVVAECKTELQQCVTSLEQATIHLTQVEQNHNYGSRVEKHRAIVKGKYT